MHVEQLIQHALRSQAQALEQLAHRGIHALCLAAECVNECKYVITLGVGKSAFIAQKMAASMVSIGIDARFLHATDALHGDIGIIRPNTILIVFSKSGETKELAELLAVDQIQNPKRVVVTSNKKSSFLRLSDIAVLLPDVPEYDTDNLLPTASTTSSMAIADAIVAAVASMNMSTAEVLRKTHPQGAIGRMLTTSIREILQLHHSTPVIAFNARLVDAINVLNSEARGIVCGISDSGTLEGILTDGDIRRLVQQGTDIPNLFFSEVATRNPTVIQPEASLHQALRVMEERERKLSVLPVVERCGCLVLFSCTMSWQSEQAQLRV